ncbi:MAG: DUF6640 family protein [Actinomycetota bacterium]
METVFDQNFTPRLIISLMALAIAIGPIFADFNKTHATNPLWPPHARFHVVWQVLLQVGSSILALVLLWRNSEDYLFHVYLAAAIIYVWIVTFYATLFSMRLFDGALRDVNGIEPFRFKLPGRVLEVDTNLFGVTVFTVLNTVAVLLIRS